MSRRELSALIGICGLALGLIRFTGPEGHEVRLLAWKGGE